PNGPPIYHLPVAVYPDITRPRCNGSHTVHPRRRRRADSDSDGYLSFKSGRAGQKHPGKQRCANKLSHVLSSLKRKETRSTPAHKTPLTTFSLGRNCEKRSSAGKTPGMF